MDFIEVKDCKKCVHVKSEMNPNYFGGCEFCFRRNDLSDFYIEEKPEGIDKKLIRKKLVKYINETPLFDITIDKLNEIMKEGLN